VPGVGADGPLGVVAPPGLVTPAPGDSPPGEPGVVGSVGKAPPAPGSVAGDVAGTALAEGLVPDRLGAPDAWPDTVVPGVPDESGTATTGWATGPDGAGTMAEKALARMTAMSRPKVMPMAVWR
jgi:hypothetical protein